MTSILFSTYYIKINKNYLFLVLIVLFTIQKNHSQTTEILGKIIADDDVENIHIMNVTSKSYAISNKKGEFIINCKLNDTINISSIKHNQFSLIVSQKNITEKTISCILQEKIVQLDEIILGNILTGDLLSDIGNIESKAPLNFYDVGIQGYTGKPKTQNERRLYTASGGGLLSFDKIINGISGHTKKLKNYVALDNKKYFLDNLKRKFSKVLFLTDQYKNIIQDDFFYSYLDDNEIISSFEDKNDLEVFILLKNKLNEYLIVAKQRNAGRVNSSAID